MDGISLIFLDVDGVLNPTSNIIKRHNQGESTSSYYIKLAEESLYYLEKLVKETGAKIVVSSSWRIGGNMENPSPAIINLTNQLAEYGLTIYGFTPRLSTRFRGNEIREFIRNCPIPVKSFVILDDDSDMCEFRKRYLVHCPTETGFRFQQYKYAKIVLNRSSLRIYESLTRDKRWGSFNNARRNYKTNIFCSE